jgi:flagellar protein FlgJ
MIDPIRGRGAGPVTPGMEIAPTAKTPLTAEQAAKDVKLRKVAGQLEGVFVQQLFKAMRDTVPAKDGIVSGGQGEDIFTSLLDEHTAAETPKHWKGGIAETLYRQLQAKNASSDPTALPTYNAPSAS